jgi:hypothetical protein
LFSKKEAIEERSTNTKERGSCVARGHKLKALVKKKKVFPLTVVQNVIDVLS